MRVPAATLAAILLSAPAFAQEHQHPPQDAKLHEHFYSTWRVPNGGNPRGSSCCNLQNCAPAETKRDHGAR